MTAEGSFSLGFVDGIPVVEIVGEVDMTNSHDLERLLDQASRSGAAAVVVSLVRVTYLDSKGVRILLRSAERLGLIRQRLLVVAPDGSIPRRILEIAGGDLPIFATVDDAVAER